MSDTVLGGTSRTSEAVSGSPNPVPDADAARLGAIFEGMLEGVALVDGEWRFRYLNEAGARNLGAPRDQLLGTTVFDRFPDLRSSPAHAAFGQSARDGQPRRFEAPLPGPDGAARWFEFSIQPTTTGMLVLSLDVTERRAAAHAEASLQAALGSIGLAAITLDADGRLRFANDAFLRATGWSADDVLGHDWFDTFVDEDARTALRAEFEAALRGADVSAKHEVDVRTRDGRRRTIVWSSTLLRNRAGRPSGIAAVGDDVTDRRALEAAFRETSRSVSAALNASEDSIAIYRPVLDADGRFADAEVVFANAATGVWLPHVDVEAARGRRLFELAPELRDSLSGLYAAVLETGRPIHVERESRLMPGARVMDVTVTPYEGGFVHVGRDVTELHRTAAELGRREEELRRTVNGVDAVIAWTTAEGAPLTLSPQVERIFGWRPDEVTSFAAWNALVHPDDLPACRAVWNSGEETWNLQYRFRRRDGSYATVVDRGRRYLDGDTRGTFGVIVDVSDRVATDAALADSEVRLRQIVEGVEAISAFQAAEGTGLLLSPQIERILGWRPDQVPDFQAWHDLVHPEDLPTCLAVWDSDATSWELEYRMQRGDGSWAWVVDRGRKVARPDDSGACYTIGIVMDTTERHRGDEALRRSEERLRRTIEGVDAIVGIQEHAGAPVIHSPQLRRILGVDPADMTSMDDWRARVHPDDLPRCLAVWDDEPTQWEMEYRMRRADGRYIWLLDRGRRIPREDGLGEGTFGISVDVTDRHLAAEALQANEEQLRRIVEGVDVMISYQEVDDGPVVISPQTERILGYPAEQAAKFEVWRSAIHPDDLPGCQATWASAALGWDMEYRMRRADGAWIWVHDRGRRLPRPDGTRGLFAVISDITAQHEAADRLRASEARFRAMFEENPEAIGVLRPLFAPDGRYRDAEFLAANRTTRDRWLGGVPVALVPGTLASGLWFTGGEEVRTAIAAVAEHGDPWRGEVRTRRDGVEVWTDLSVFPFEDGVAFVGRDVTERRAAAAGLAQLAAFQRSVLDAMAEGMAILGPDGRVTSANARAAAILGIDAAQLPEQRPGLGTDVRSADGTPVADEDTPGMRTLRTGESCRDLEVSVARQDGARIWLRVNTEPLRDRENKVIAAVATFADITAERELGEQLRRSQRLEAIGQLAGGVAHDFNNLLAAIRGYSELAIAGLPTSASARADLQEVLRAADRAAALTRQLLLFSRREVLAPKLVDPAVVVEGLVPMLSQLVGEHIELSASSDGSGGRILADPGQLEQVVLNLVVNARDAMPGGGLIEIATRRVLPDPGVDGERPAAWPAMRITVADTGGGIDPQVLPRIFEPFFTTKEAGGGSGMGLATVYGIVGVSGGTVSVASEPERGTTFTVDLPLVDEAAVVAAGGEAVPTREVRGAPGSRASAAERGSILLVEDDAAVRGVLARMLGGLGWRVEALPSGTAAVERLARGLLEKPDLLVTDVRMPGLQGPDLARRLRSAWDALPVLFITGLADEVGAEPDEAWMRVLTKPVDIERLRRAIEDTLAGGG